ncbi:MAG: SUMF1/EgtB/PvdO family nonheme iron enzyme [Acidobacteriota bacterium]|nr:SUMF1/EgtB/PvdO family nonheme iron enzyme [Acidobacteriota bacterium]
MKLRLVIFILLFGLIPQPAATQEANRPLNKNQIIALVKAGMDSQELAKKVQQFGIDFAPTDDYLQGLRQAGAQDVLIQVLRSLNPKPLTREQVLELVAGRVPSERAALLVKQRGIDFVPDDEYVATLRVAGAEDSLLAALREAGAAVPAHLELETSPNAEVSLDGHLAGRAGADGRFSLNSTAGAHTVRISLAGKKDFQQGVPLTPDHSTRISAVLTDLPGKVLIHTSPFGSVYLDNVWKEAGADGRLTLTDVTPGFHTLRIADSHKRDFRQNLSVAAGQELTVEAPLADLPHAGPMRQNPKDGLNYVWIPAGEFPMGCSPGEFPCWPDEKLHTVTFTNGFWIGTTKVTVGAYKHFAMAARRGMPKPPPSNLKWGEDLQPMVNLTWEGWRAYCHWAGGRLPTEAEWEYAARGVGTDPFYAPLDEIAWYVNNSGDRLHPVGQKKPNGFGLFDTIGDTWEWVNDWYDSDYYHTAYDPPGPTKETFHVMRGSSILSERNYNMAVWHRVGIAPQYMRADIANFISCRCVWETGGRP